jgi:DNA-binding response OmpR family regulator
LYWWWSTRIWVQLSKSSEIKIGRKETIFRIEDSNIFFRKKLLDLTAIEFNIFFILIKNQNQTTKREYLLQTLSSISSHRSLDNHIKNIRKKIGDNGNQAIFLKTEYGVGYKLLNSISH